MGIIHSVVRACMMTVWWLRATVVDLRVNWTGLTRFPPTVVSFANSLATTWAAVGVPTVFGLMGFEWDHGGSSELGL